MRWELGPKIDLYALILPGETPAEAPVLRDVEPDAFWDADARELTVTTKPYNPEAEVSPIVAAVVVVPDGSEFLGASADELILSSLPRTTTPLSTDPAGGESTPVPLPGYDDSINNAVVLLYGYRV